MREGAQVMALVRRGDWDWNGVLCGFLAGLIRFVLTIAFGALVRYHDFEYVEYTCLRPAMILFNPITVLLAVCTHSLP